MHSPPAGIEHIARGISDKNKDIWVYKWYIIINYEVLSGIGGLEPDLFQTRAIVFNLRGVWTPLKG